MRHLKKGEMKSHHRQEFSCERTLRKAIARWAGKHFVKFFTNFPTRSLFRPENPKSRSYHTFIGASYSSGRRLFFESRKTFETGLTRWEDLRDSWRNFGAPHGKILGCKIRKRLGGIPVALLEPNSRGHHLSTLLFRSKKSVDARSRHFFGP